MHKFCYNLQITTGGAFKIALYFQIIIKPFKEN